MLDSISVKFVTGYPCVIPYIFFHIHVSIICIVFELTKCPEITQFQNSR